MRSKRMMRQNKKKIEDETVIVGLLNACHVGRLGTIARDGYPMVKPLNFAYDRGRIYFHTAKEGEKLDDIRRDNRVCFEVDLPIALVKSKGSPCRAEYLFRSVIIKGRARIVEDASERMAALMRLMEKYQPEGGYGEFPEEKLKMTGVVRIDIEEMAGKEDLGKDQVKDAALKALEESSPLPVVLERA
ncbi:MAG TPA: pyridoxamine 5'-phosphate oxidase family protein [Nitrospirota bacterium]